MNNPECNCDEPCLKLDGGGGFTCLRCGKPAARVPEPVADERTQEVVLLRKWAERLCDSDMDAEDMR